MSVAVALSQREAPAEERAVRISDGVMLRIGGLDYAAIDALHSPEISVTLREEQHLLEQCAAFGEVVTEALFEAIHNARHDQAVRNAFLAVKRDIFNRRRPGRAALATCIAHLPAAFARDAEVWRAALDAIDRHREQAAALVATVRDAGRCRLQQLVLETDFRLGLLTSSPALETALVRYAAAPAGKLNRKMRHIEEAVVQFVCRTACKTSPFGRLTLVGFGLLEEGEGLPLVPPLAARVVASVRPNLSLLGRLRHLILQNLTRFPELEVTIQDQLSESGRRLSYRRRVEAVSQQLGPIHASAREYVFSITRTAALGALVERLDGGRSLRVRDLVEVLETTGMNAEQGTSYLQLLADKGLLKPAGLQTAVLDSDCWRQFSDQLRRADDPWLQEAAAAIGEVVDGARAYGEGDVDDRRAVIAGLEARLDDIVAAVAPTTRAPRPIVYEDATLSRTPLPLPRGKWHAAIADLPRIQRFLSLYDPLLLSRLALKAMFVHRYGRGGTCDDLSAFSDFFHDRFYTAFTAGDRKTGNFGSGRLNAAHAPELAIVERARDQVRAAVAAASTMAEGGEIELAPALVGEIGELAASFQNLLSNSFYLQFAHVGGRQRVVLNRVYGGGGSSFSRFEGLFSDDTGADPIHALLQHNAALELDGNRLTAEFHGGYDTNLNQHALTTPAEIVFPGERPAGPHGARIRVDELSLRHDSHDDRMYLYCERLGREVTPVYAGMFYPLALPELQTLLMHFSYPVHLQADLFEDGEEGDRFFPRVRCGEVILARAKWAVDAAALPVRDGAEDDYALLSRYAQWRTERGLPRHCFAQILSRKAAHSLADQKPFLVDFESPFSIAMLEKANSDRSGHAEFSEMLPRPEDAVVLVEDQPRVAEFVVEITQGAQR